MTLLLLLLLGRLLFPFLLGGNGVRRLRGGRPLLLGSLPGGAAPAHRTSADREDAEARGGEDDDAAHQERQGAEGRSEDENEQAGHRQERGQAYDRLRPGVTRGAST